PAARVERLLDCSNPYDYAQSPGVGGEVSEEELAEFSERCQSEGQLFVGGEGVTGLSQLRDGTLFVVGKFQRKLAGEVHCGIDVTVDHCASLDPAHASQEACEGAGQEWVVMQPHCSNAEYQDPVACTNNGGTWENGVGFSHYDAVGSMCFTAATGFVRNYLECRTPGQAEPGLMPGLLQEVNGLAYLAPRADATGSELRLLSEPTEEVERYWALEGENGPELY